MPSVLKTITRSVVRELDAGGDTMKVRSALDADKFHCFCLVGTNTRYHDRADLTLEDILESDEGEGQCDELDSGLPGACPEEHSKFTKPFCCGGYYDYPLAIPGDHESRVWIIIRKPTKKLPTSFLSVRTRGEDLNLVTETLETTQKETLTGKSLNLEDLRNMKEKVQDTVSGLQDLTEEEREDVLRYLMKCLATDEEPKDLDQWFSTFLMPRPFKTAPRVVVTPNHTIISVATSSLSFCYCDEL